MRLPTVFLLTISCALGLEQESCYLTEEEEDQCASVCYPIVKPLLRYFEVCQTKDRTNAELHKKLSEAQNQLSTVNSDYTKLLEKNLAATEVEVKYAQVQEKFNQTSRELRNSKESLQKSKNKNAELKKTFNEVNSQNAKLQEQNSEVQNRFNDLNIKYKLLEEKHTAAQDRCTEVEGRLAKVQEKLDSTNREFGQSQERLQQINSKYDRVQDEFKKVNIEYEEFRRKDLQVRSLETQITDKISQIKVLNDRISDLEKSSELGELNKRFSEELEKLQKITKAGQEVKIGSGNNDSNVNLVTRTGATNTTTSPSNPEKPIRVLPDRCPATQDEYYSYPEIQIPGLEPFEVACYSNKMIGSGWMQVYYKYQESTNFDRTYEDFINGFGDRNEDLDEVFMGLEKIHILTNWKPHEVRIDQTHYKGRCNTFVVGDKSEGYMLKKLDGCTGDTENLDIIQGTKFSTKDRDEDGNPYKNWAKELGFGWWWHYWGPKYMDNRGRLTISIRRKD